MKSLKLVSSIVVVLVLAVAILSACAKPAPTTTTPAATTPAATKPAATTPAATKPAATTPAATTPAPQPKAEVLSLRYADIYARNSAYSTPSVAWCKQVEELTNGRIKFTYYATGELLASGEIFDGVTKGLVEAAALGMGYATGIVGKVQNMDSAGAAFMDPFKIFGMYYDGFGEPTAITKLVQKYYSAAGVMPLPSFMSKGVDWVYSTVKINSANDLKGLPYRTSGMSAEILTKLGAATVWLAWEELYTALQMGTVKAAEWGSPSLMYGMGLQEVAKYWYMPGFWSGYTESRIINMNAWKKMSVSEQKILESVAKGLWLNLQANLDREDEAAINNAKQKGVQVFYWTDADLKVFKDAWKAVIDEIGASGQPNTADMYKLIKDYRTSVNEW